MIRFTTFVDGSNFIGSLDKMNLQVEDYEALFRHINERSFKIWSDSMLNGNVACQLHRVYWYALGSLDNFDLNDSNFISHLKELFEKDTDLKNSYLQLVGPKNPQKSHSELLEFAWQECFSAGRDWYQNRNKMVEGFIRFYYGVKAGTNFIDIIECGHWKVNLLKRYVEEKGLDTRLAVDIVTQRENYDVALIVSGDADSIPSINFAKNSGKQVGVIEFIKGAPPDKKGKQFSSKLKAAADFVVPIYETELLNSQIAQRLSSKT